LECLHHHTHFGMFSDRILEAHRAQILSCFGPKVGAWFTTQPIFPTFQLSSPIFSATIRTWLRLPHPLIGGFP